MPGKPPTVANLTWIGDLKFAAAFPKHVHEATRGEGDPAERVAGAGAPGVILDSTRVAGASPSAAPPRPRAPRRRARPTPHRHHTRPSPPAFRSPPASPSADTRPPP